MSILIVDDHRSLQQMLTIFLEDAGYEAVTASNGAEALAYLRHSAELPGLILLDVAMPKMSGWEFLRYQQRDARFADIPVVVMTALRLSDCREHAPNAVAVVDKPMNLLDLAEVLEAHYQPQHPVEESRTR
jgi:CheY-like chemotaxis protein